MESQYTVSVYSYNRIIRCNGKRKQEITQTTITIKIPRYLTIITLHFNRTIKATFNLLFVIYFISSQCIYHIRSTTITLIYYSR